MKHILRVNFLKCQQCDVCEDLLPGFRTIQGGIACHFDNWASSDDEVLALLHGVMDRCPGEALVLVTY